MSTNGDLTVTSTVGTGAGIAAGPLHVSKTIERQADVRKGSLGGLAQTMNNAGAGSGWAIYAPSHAH